MKLRKVNILSPGRFHVCDLARELDRCGWNVKFYSYVPTWRAAKFGLPKHCNKSLVGILFPLLALVHFFPKIRWIKTLCIYMQDYITAIYMRKCDILIAMSGNFVYSLKKAKKNGAIIILERGSKHILEQKRILETIPSLKDKKIVSNVNVKRELRGYEIADYISIPSQHVKDSFVIHGYPIEKLFINPYGVDLRMFYPMPEIEKKYDVIMVGGWSYRKGCDLIIEACKKMNISLLHVGGIADLDFPQEINFTHINPVDQTQLINYYNQAKVFILPSREEGLAMVQAQAISCNLPIVCSKHSGGEDLKQYFEDSSAIIVMNEISVLELEKSIKKALNIVDNCSNLLYKMEGKQQLSWTAYGDRYSDFLNQLIIN